MTAISIIGDGLAGLMLADRLLAEGYQVSVYGQACSNTPPVGLVHLFAGRTFRRSDLELVAFEKAISHWRQEPLAQEFEVHRVVQPGDRLHRSAAAHNLPPHYAPRPLREGWVQYGPGFSVASKNLETRLRKQLEPCFRSGWVQPNSIAGKKVLALGSGVATWWPEVAWDLSSGRTVQAQPVRPASAIMIGLGMHIAPAPGQTEVVLGGRFSPHGLPEDEIAKAQELTGLEHREGDAWYGQRCSPALDRRPCLGYLGEDSFAFFGFGSRALFWLPHCLDLAVLALAGGSLPEDLQVTRLQPSIKA